MIHSDEFATKKNHEFITQVLPIGEWDIEVRSSDSSGNENTSTASFIVDVEERILNLMTIDKHMMKTQNASGFASSDVIQIGILVTVLYY